MWRAVLGHACAALVGDSFGHELGGSGALVQEPSCKALQEVTYAE